MNNRELLPCPCCDSAELDYAANESSPKLSDYIMCNGQDGCGLMISREDTPNGDLLAAWNKRPTRPAQTEQQQPVADDAPPCWWIDHGSHGQITQRQDEAESAASEGKRVVRYTSTPIAQTEQPEQGGLVTEAMRAAAIAEYDRHDGDFADFASSVIRAALSGSRE